MLSYRIDKRVERHYDVEINFKNKKREDEFEIEGDLNHIEFENIIKKYKFENQKNKIGIIPDITNYNNKEVYNITNSNNNIIHSELIIPIQLGTIPENKIQNLINLGIIETSAYKIIIVPIEKITMKVVKTLGGSQLTIKVSGFITGISIVSIIGEIISGPLGAITCAGLYCISKFTNWLTNKIIFYNKRPQINTIQLPIIEEEESITIRQNYQINRNEETLMNHELLFKKVFEKSKNIFILNLQSFPYILIQHETMIVNTLSTPEELSKEVLLLNMNFFGNIIEKVLNICNSFGLITGVDMFQLYEKMNQEVSRLVTILGQTKLLLKIGLLIYKVSQGTMDLDTFCICFSSFVEQYFLNKIFEIFGFHLNKEMQKLIENLFSDFKENTLKEKYIKEIEFIKILVKKFIEKSVGKIVESIQMKLEFGEVSLVGDDNTKELEILFNPLEKLFNSITF